MTSTLTGKTLLLVNRVLSLHHLIQYYISHNLGVASKVTTLEMGSMFFFADRLLHLQVVFRVAEKNATMDIGYHCTNSSLLGMICTNILMKPTEIITNRATTKFMAYLLMISGLWDVFYTTVFFVSHFVILIVKKLIDYFCFYIPLLPFIYNVCDLTLRFIRHL